MKAITLISIAKSVAMEIDIVGVTVDRSRTDGPSWIAKVEATYEGAQHVFKAEGASAEDAQRGPVPCTGGAAGCLYIG